MTRWRADLLLLLTAALWGFAFVMQKTAMDTLAPMTFIAARATVASIVLAPLALVEHRRCGQCETQPLLWVLALSAAFAFLIGAGLQQFGLQSTSVTNASFLTALYAVATPFVVWLAFRRAPSSAIWLAAAASLTGAYLLAGGDLTDLSTGDGLVAAGAIVWAVHIVISALAAEYNRPVLFTAIQFAAVAVAAAAIAGATETIRIDALKATAAEIAYVGVISSALTFTLFAEALRHAPPAEAAIILSTENVFAAIAGAWLMGDRLEWINWLGAALILVAVIAAQTSARRDADDVQ